MRVPVLIVLLIALGGAIFLLPDCLSELSEKYENDSQAEEYPAVGYSPSAIFALVPKQDVNVDSDGWGVAFLVSDLLNFSGEEPALYGDKVPGFREGRLTLVFECAEARLERSVLSPTIRNLGKVLCSLQKEPVTEFETVTLFVNLGILTREGYTGSATCFDYSGAVRCDGVEQGLDVQLYFSDLKKPVTMAFQNEVSDLFHSIIEDAKSRFQRANGDRNRVSEVTLSGRALKFTVSSDLMEGMTVQSSAAASILRLKNKPGKSIEFGIVILRSSGPALGPNDADCKAPILCTTFY